MNHGECVCWRSADQVLTRIPADSSFAMPEPISPCSPNVESGMQSPKPGHTFSGLPGQGAGAAHHPPPHQRCSGTVCWHLSRGCSRCSRRGSGVLRTRTLHAESSAREEARDRTFSPTEHCARAEALRRCEDRHPAQVAAIRLAAVTGHRIGEILAIRWEHLDLATDRLTLPATKTGRRLHDLPAAALAILTDLPLPSHDKSG